MLSSSKATVTVFLFMFVSTEVTESRFWMAARAFAELAPQVTPGVSSSYVTEPACAEAANARLANRPSKIDRFIESLLALSVQRSKNVSACAGQSNSSKFGC
jgi:hypothetical protein